MYYALLLLAILFWSGNFVVGRGIYHEIPAVTLTFWRWFLALLILLPFSFRYVAEQLPVIRKNLKILFLMAVLSVAGFPICLYKALSLSTVANTALINSTTPVFIVLFSLAGFRGSITLRQTAGVALSMAGMLFIITRGNPAILADVQFSRGDLWILCAATSWALYSNMLRHYPIDLHPLGFLTTLVGLALIFILPFYTWEILFGQTVHLTPAAVAGIGYIAVFPSILSYLFWNMAVQHVGASKAGIFIHLIPVFSILMAILFLDELLKGYQIRGATLIFLGIYLTTAERLMFQKKVKTEKRPHNQ